MQHKFMDTNWLHSNCSISNELAVAEAVKRLIGMRYEV